LAVIIAGLGLGLSVVKLVGHFGEHCHEWAGIEMDDCVRGKEDGMPNYSFVGDTKGVR
jgi:hypothetical protein